MRRPSLAPKTAAVLLALAALPAGCNNSPPGAGFTNTAPGESAGSDKASVRDDLPGVPPNPHPVESGAESSATRTVAPDPTKDNSKQTAPEAASQPPASPPKKENTGGASGATKPDETIKTGTPRGPQL